MTQNELVKKSDLEIIQMLVDSGQYEEALVKYLWFHEASKTVGSLAGVRLSYALEQWVELCEKYPKAKVALDLIRENHRLKLLAGNGSFHEFHEFYAICWAFEELHKIYELFLQLENDFPEIANVCYCIVEKQFFSEKPFDFCAKYIGDPILAFENAKEMRETMVINMNGSEKQKDQEILKPVDELHIDKVRLLMEVMINTNREKIAKEIQRLALVYFEDIRIRAYFKV